MFSLLADAHIPYIEELFAKNFKISFYQNARDLEMRELNVDVLICRSNTKIQTQYLDQGQLKVLATASSGTEHIDISGLNEKGIRFFSGHGANAHGVCDYVTSSLAYLLQENILTKPKIAIIGYGAVGQKLYKRLSFLGFELGIYDPFIPQRPQAIDLKHLKNFDFICLHPNYHQHQPYATHHLINEDILSTLTSNCCILNAARGKIVDEAALLHGFKGNYCSDVFCNEPQINPELIARAILATPHIAGHTIEAKRNISLMLAQKIHDFFSLNWKAPKLLVQTKEDITQDNWKSRALEHYHPILETQALKANPSPEEFSRLRRLHHFRHDFPWMI